MDSFVGARYDPAFGATKNIVQIAEQHRVSVVFGIENEIDFKSWMLQSLPGVGWRKCFPAWALLACDRSMKYRRLNNILSGVMEAEPSARTITNVLAEDWRFLLESIWSRIGGHMRILRENSIHLDEMTNRA